MLRSQMLRRRPLPRPLARRRRRLPRPLPQQLVRRPARSGVKSDACVARSGVRRGAKVAGSDVWCGAKVARSDVRYGALVSRRRSKCRCSAVITSRGSPEGGPLVHRADAFDGTRGDNTMRCGRHETMSGLTTNEIAAFVALALLLALVLVFLLR